MALRGAPTMEKRGKNGWKMGKMATFDPFLGQFSHFSAIFPPFPGGAKIHFSAISFPFRAGGPIWGLHKAIGIASQAKRTSRFCLKRALVCLSHNLSAQLLRPSQPVPGILDLARPLTDLKRTFRLQLRPMCVSGLFRNNKTYHQKNGCPRDKLGLSQRQTRVCRASTV